jgi:hypothetical protein
MRDYDWASCDEYSNPYWATAHFTNAELHAIQARLTSKFPDRLAWHHRWLTAQSHVPDAALPGNA